VIQKHGLRTKTPLVLILVLSNFGLFGVPPILGNLHLYLHKYTHNYILYTATYIFIYSTVYTIPIGSPYGIFTLHV